MKARAKLLAWYAVRPGEISGQLLANRLALDVVSKSGVDVVAVELPAWPGRASAALGFAKDLWCAWQRVGVESSDAAALFVGAGQSWASLFRELLPLLAVKRRRPDLGVVVTLHGSLFFHWAADSWLARIYSRVLREASVVTCLGPRQRATLIRRGLAPKAARIVNNAPFGPVPEREVIEQKWGSGPLRFVFLSNLIEEKGYRVFLQAVELMAREGGPPIDVVLCGPLSGPDRRRVDVEELLERIASRGVAVRWLPGAFGSEKMKLLAATHVFVLPTTYRVEAQPMVLIEAMACGCAIVTTNVGEIPSMFGDGDAVVVDQDAVNASTVASVLRELRSDRSRTRALGERARRRYEHSFSEAQFREAWTGVARELLGHG